jgi:hypothetical protein
MPSTSSTALLAIADVAAAQRGIVTAAQMAEIGVARTTIRHRARQGGPWTRVLPATYHVSTAPLTSSQRLQAGLLYAGERSALTGLAALHWRGNRSAARLWSDEVHVLVPHAYRRVSNGFVMVERTKRWPVVDTVHGLPVVTPSRAAIDACRTIDRRSDVQALLSEVVQTGAASTRELLDELRQGQRRRTALAREVVLELAKGPASVAELELFRLWTDAGLPAAVWNADLCTPDGALLARPDAYLTDVGVAVEVDSLAFHYTREQWEATMRRHARMTSHGVLVLHFTPARIRTSWPEVRRELDRAIRSRAGQSRPDLVVRPMSA